MARQEFGLKAAVIAGVAVVTATIVLVFGALTADRFRTAPAFNIRLPLLAPAATEEAAA